MPSLNSNLIRINQLLTALADQEYQRLVPHLEEVSVPLGQILYQPGEPILHIYFPNRAMVSLVTLLANGSTTEVGMVGKEGMVGIPVFLGDRMAINQAVVQLEGTAMKMDASILKREFDRGGRLQQLLLFYTQTLLNQVSQTAACNRQHRLEQRLARWLLSAQDSISGSELRLTQEFLGNMLGTRRATVTVAAGKLQEAGAIRHHRGKITILNRELLETIACECYSVVKHECDRLLYPKQGDR
ncbi:cyclic nucleotide-binding domain protein [Coleofasciculus chthonoplastes PCC 7420]|uniref:Cyclic nucleotide-binding domain protein n=1 Tax=Coleofasciculus chthonoplastes PCC 7420 TaxID=118168 RepID=B4W3M7_9CYAN|nr:Crp/Fnr family transcriptional regulator [Coleofasciculus chthonoplastes]EDX71232.1 cyclic nucleotide-binding domain protein [Coleofasciculus chthonoplastes PCC 7420]